MREGSYEDIHKLLSLEAYMYATCEYMRVYT